MNGTAERARSLLARPGAWIESSGDGAYVVRLSPDRRRRASLRLDEDAFSDLVGAPGLVVRPQGGWRARPTPRLAPSPAAAPGQPGFIAGERQVMAPDGTLSRRRANLGESPIAWLARRKDPSGRPWLSPAEVAAGERLRADHEFAGRGPSLTMRWDALPRAGSGAGVEQGPGDRARAARRRIEAALAAVPPPLRPMLEQVCLHGSSLQLAEQGLGFRKRQGKTVLKAGLAALARHYRIG